MNAHWRQAQEDLFRAADLLEGAARSVARAAGDSEEMAGNDRDFGYGRVQHRDGRPVYLQDATKFAERLAAQAYGTRIDAENMGEGEERQ